jgi:peptidoglycan/LPS O-acetylase OafA/YrhL
MPSHPLRAATARDVSPSITESRLNTVSGSDGGKQRLSGVDSLRFVCAIVVLLGHLGLTSQRLHGADEQVLAKVLIGLYNSLFNAPAAVICFFVISGLCIHFPQRKNRKIQIGPFFVRRFLRILPPALVILAIMRLALKDNSSPQDTVLWSILCECIYYLLYPILLFIRRQSAWIVMIAGAYAAAAATIAWNYARLQPGDNAYVALGAGVTWIIGLPCWLLGCWLAENLSEFKTPKRSSLWILRFAILGLSIALRLAKFHISSKLASNCILLDIFAPLVCYWLGTEVANAREYGAVSYLERAGQWSYSLYLVHPLTIPLFSILGFSAALLTQYHWIVLASALAASYVFYLLVEKPSHRAAVFIGRHLFEPAQLDHHRNAPALAPKSREI